LVRALRRAHGPAAVGPGLELHPAQRARGPGAARARLAALRGRLSRAHHGQRLREREAVSRGRSLRGKASARGARASHLRHEPTAHEWPPGGAGPCAAAASDRPLDPSMPTRPGHLIAAVVLTTWPTP